jgi:hypothetical protein
MLKYSIMKNVFGSEPAVGCLFQTSLPRSPHLWGCSYHLICNVGCEKGLKMGFLLCNLQVTIKNKNYFPSDTDIHDINTHYSYNLHLPSTNLSIIQKAVLFSRSKIYNHLPLNIKLSSKDFKNFKTEKLSH